MLTTVRHIFGRIMHSETALCSQWDKGWKNNLLFASPSIRRPTINETTMILYTFLLDRARLSLKSDKWTDESGHTFLYYPVKSLAETLHKSEMTVKTSLAALEKADLIRRVKQGAGMPSRIYVKIPAERERKLSVGGTEYYHTEGQETVCRRDRKLSTIKNNGYKTKYQEKEYRDYSCRENESL